MLKKNFDKDFHNKLAEKRHIESVHELERES